LFSLGACEDPNELGVELPGTTPIGTAFEDFTVTASTILQDSLPTLKRDLWLVGRVQDGNTQGTITTRTALELTLSRGDTLPSQFTNSQLDSVVMFANFSRVYGSATQPVQLDIYNLAQKLDEKVNYHSSMPIQTSGAPISKVTLTNLNRVTRNKANTADSIQLPLRLPLAERKAKDGSNTLTPFFQDLFSKMNTAGFNQQQLDAYWRGLGIAPSDGYSGAIIGFNRTTDAVIYVHFSVNGKPKAFRLYFGDPTAAGSGAAAPLYYTQISYDRNGGPFASLVKDSDEVSAAVTGDVTYAQDGTGLVTKLSIPGLNTLLNRPGLLINRAELTIPVRPYSNALFPLPPAMYLYEASPNNRVLLRKVGLTPTERLVQANGNNPTGSQQEAVLALAETSATNKYYSAVITSYVQAYANDQLSGERPSSFLLTPNLRRLGLLSLNRATLDATGMRLRVYYTTPQR
jgi:hypothetical protein